MTVILCQTLPSVSLLLLSTCKELLITYQRLGAPVLKWVTKGVPGVYMDCHMMVSDPLRVHPLLFSLLLPRLT